MFLAFSNKISTVQKIMRSSSRGQGNFRGFKASRPRPRLKTSKCVLEAKDVLEDSTSGNNHHGFTILWHSPVPGAPRSDGETFVVFTYIWQEDVAKISKVPGAPRNVNSARAITSRLGVTFYCIVFI